jgi:hypothetical protein
MKDLFETKPIPITKEMVRQAYRKVLSNKGSAGVDEEDWQKFNQDLSNNYPITCTKFGTEWQVVAIFQNQ